VNSALRVAKSCEENAVTCIVMNKWIKKLSPRRMMFTGMSVTGVKMPEDIMVFGGGSCMKLKRHKTASLAQEGGG
jgi:hypothetical protein